MATPNEYTDALPPLAEMEVSTARVKSEEEVLELLRTLAPERLALRA